MNTLNGMQKLTDQAPAATPWSVQWVKQMETSQPLPAARLRWTVEKMHFCGLRGELDVETAPPGKFVLDICCNAVGS